MILEKKKLFSSPSYFDAKYIVQCLRLISLVPSEVLCSSIMINSSLRHRTHFVQPFISHLLCSFTGSIFFHKLSFNFIPAWVLYIIPWPWDIIFHSAINTPSVDRISQLKKNLLSSLLFFLIRSSFFIFFIFFKCI